MVLKRSPLIALGLVLSLWVTACGEASFSGKGGKKSDPKSEAKDPNSEIPLVPNETKPDGTTPKGTTPEGTNGTTPEAETPGTETPETENPTLNPETPGTGTPDVPTVPNGGEPTPDCVTQNGTIVPCPNDITTSPSQN